MWNGVLGDPVIARSDVKADAVHIENAQKWSNATWRWDSYGRLISRLNQNACLMPGTNLTKLSNPTLFFRFCFVSQSQ